MVKHFSIRSISENNFYYWNTFLQLYEIKLYELYFKSGCLSLAYLYKRWVQIKPSPYLWSLKYFFAGEINFEIFFCADSLNFYRIISHWHSQLYPHYCFPASITPQHLPLDGIKGEAAAFVAHAISWMQETVKSRLLPPTS